MAIAHTGYEAKVANVPIGVLPLYEAQIAFNE
jgi:hypothetical protein